MCSELRQFKENNGGSPEYAINMCFGEKFPDGKPLEKKLIVVKVTLTSLALKMQSRVGLISKSKHVSLQVVPLICRHFHEMAQMEGASSLHSANVSLQISHNSLFDLINSVFGVPMAELEPAQPAIPFLPQM